LRIAVGNSFSIFFSQRSANLLWVAQGGIDFPFLQKAEEYIERMQEWELYEIFAGEGISGTDKKKHKAFDFPHNFCLKQELCGKWLLFVFFYVMYK